MASLIPTMQGVSDYQVDSFISADPREELRNYYRYPAGLLDIRKAGPIRSSGFFGFGQATCFGECTLENITAQIGGHRAALPDATAAAILDSCAIGLPFDISEVVDNLRLERYVKALDPPRNLRWARAAYYRARKFMPVGIRKHFQRLYLARWRKIAFPRWPVDCSVELLYEEVIRLAIQAQGAPIPFVWFWPEGHQACLMMTHDVEEAAGLEFCSRLMDLEETAGLRSSFQLIPEGRYRVPESLLDEIRTRGHEANVHDLNHDGHLFSERAEFLRRAAKIGNYARAFGAKGFRSGVLYRNLDWYDAFDFQYDMSVPNVAHLDPQRGGCCTVMPYFIGRVLELPLTTTQDYSLFNVLQEYSLRLWEEQINKILVRHGLLSFNIHPDYSVSKSTQAVYVGLLSRLRSLQADQNVWAALPRDVNHWWRQRSNMELIHEDGGWRITGEGSERARLAYAMREGERLVYRLQPRIPNTTE